MRDNTFTASVLVLVLAGTLLAAAPGTVRAGARGGAATATDTAAVVLPKPAPALLLDAGDLGFGATVVFPRVPSAAELHDLQYLESVSHVLLQLPAWPTDVSQLQPLTQMNLPEGADLVVVLPGYPSTHAEAEAWNLLRRPARLIMVVNGPPVDRDMIFAMNAMRGLERVVVDMARPSRSGFERLQRPLGFRVVMP